MKDVAEAVGVSMQTVSRVLNNHPDVSPETVERVRQVIADVGYAPNILARGLIQGRTYVLGVVAYGLHFFGPSQILTGIEEQAADLGYSITLTLVHSPETDNVEDLLLGLVGRQVDGIIWAIPEIANNRRWLESGRPSIPVPVVLVGGLPGEWPVSSVGIDNQAIGRLATEHLLAGGACHVAIVTGPLEWRWSQQRLAGWRDTLSAAGVEEDPNVIVEGDWTPASGEQALHRLLAQAPDIDAIFASNDQMALGILYGAQRLGIRVPEELSVVGVDDFPEGSHFWPPLTTVYQPQRDAGAVAVANLDKMVQATLPRRRTEVPREPLTRLLPKLIVRASSRRVPEHEEGASHP